MPENPVSATKTKSSSSTPSKKSKHKKKKRKPLKEDITTSSTPSERPSTPALSNMDDIDRAIQEISQKYGDTTSPSSPSSTTTQSLSKKYSLLSISLKNLDSDLELRKLFGKIVDIEARESRRQPIHGIPARVINRIKATQSPQRRTLMKPKDEWQLFAAYNKRMLSMDIVEKIEGVTRFKFVHSRGYRHIQLQFFMTALGGDANILMGLLREHPFHVDAW